MIKIVMAGICENCTHADFELDRVQDMFGRNTWSISCIHSDACCATETRTVQRVTKWMADERELQQRKEKQ